MDLQQAIKRIPNLERCFCKGLRAMGADSVLVVAADTRKCTGSIDLDSCPDVEFPEPNRWDFVLEYASQLWFVEPHPVNSSEVYILIRKLNSLKGWLREQGSPVNQIPKSTYPYVVISTQTPGFSKSSRYYRMLTKIGLRIASKSLSIPEPRLY